MISNIFSRLLIFTSLDFCDKQRSFQNLWHKVNTWIEYSVKIIKREILCIYSYLYLCINSYYRAWPKFWSWARLLTAAFVKLIVKVFTWVGRQVFQIVLVHTQFPEQHFCLVFGGGHRCGVFVTQWWFCCSPRGRPVTATTATGSTGDDNGCLAPVRVKIVRLLLLCVDCCLSFEVPPWNLLNGFPHFSWTVNGSFIIQGYNWAGVQGPSPLTIFLNIRTNFEM